MLFQFSLFVKAAGCEGVKRVEEGNGLCSKSFTGSPEGPPSEKIILKGSSRKPSAVSL